MPFSSFRDFDIFTSAFEPFDEDTSWYTLFSCLLVGCSGVLESVAVLVAIRNILAMNIIKSEGSGNIGVPS